MSPAIGVDETLKYTNNDHFILLYFKRGVESKSVTEDHHEMYRIGPGRPRVQWLGLSIRKASK